jgi:phosphopantothenoylcysteine decarboxylase/phosphopantothenate--cysteine ligase
MSKEKTMLLGVTASIAIYRACELVRRLRGEGFIVEVVMSEEAKCLVSPQVFASLSGRQVHSGLFCATQNWAIEHVSLAEAASLVLVAPATANVIAKIACGICDDLLTCVICATKAPVLFAPAMNENMYLNKITQGNIQKLKALGYKFIAPKKGRLVCGREGVGCLAEVETIVQEVKRTR